MSRPRAWIVLCWGFVGGLACATEVYIAPMHVFSAEPGVVLDERDRGVTQDLIDRLIQIDLAACVCGSAGATGCPTGVGRSERAAMRLDRSGCK